MSGTSNWHEDFGDSPSTEESQEFLEYQEVSEMNKISLAEGYSSLEVEGKVALFVNSKEPPYKEIPLNHFRYDYSPFSETLQFSRLYRIVYLMESDGVGIHYSLYDWKIVKVKKGCEKTLCYIIDAQNGVEELLCPK